MKVKDKPNLRNQSDLLQSESPAIRMARKYNDNKHLMDLKSETVNENSDGELAAVNDELRISEEELDIPANQKRRIYYNK